jgi:hypothetical protein
LTPSAVSAIMAAMARRGRKKKFDTEGFVPHSFQLPKEVADALEEYSHDKRKWKTEVIRDRLEDLLEREGYLKVVVGRDPEGREVRTYVALRPRR